MAVGHVHRGLVPAGVPIVARIVLIVRVVGVVVATAVTNGGLQVVAAAVGTVAVVGRAGGIAVWAVESVVCVIGVHGLVLVVVFVVGKDVLATDLDVLAAALRAGIIHLVGTGKSAVGAEAGGVVGVGKVCVSHVA